MPWLDDVLALEPTARRAPSVLNTQPAVLRRTEQLLEVGWDPRRMLTALDPDGSQLMLSLGAFIEALRLAGGDAGVGIAVEYVPNPAGSRFALLRPGPALRSPFGVEELRNRVSGAGRFAQPFPSLREIEHLAERAELPAGVRLVAWESPTGGALAEHAHRWLFATPEPRRELRAWVRPGADDGVEPAALGLPPWRARLFLAARGAFDDATADLLGGHPRGLGTLAALVDSGPAGRPGRLGAMGAGLLRLGLRAARHGLRLQLLPHLTACPDTREQLADLVEASGDPGRIGCVVRIGTPQRESPLSRRRPTPVQDARDT